jgi:hypothetical protein
MPMKPNATAHSSETLERCSGGSVAGFATASWAVSVDMHEQRLDHGEIGAAQPAMGGYSSISSPQ